MFRNMSLTRTGGSGGGGKRREEVTMDHPSHHGQRHVQQMRSRQQSFPFASSSCTAGGRGGGGVRRPRPNQWVRSQQQDQQQQQQQQQDQSQQQVQSQSLPPGGQRNDEGLAGHLHRSEQQVQHRSCLSAPSSLSSSGGGMNTDRVPHAAALSRKMTWKRNDQTVAATTTTDAAITSTTKTSPPVQRQQHPRTATATTAPPTFSVPKSSSLGSANKTWKRTATNTSSSKQEAATLPHSGSSSGGSTGSTSSALASAEHRPTTTNNHSSNSGKNKTWRRTEIANDSKNTTAAAAATEQVSLPPPPSRATASHRPTRKVVGNKTWKRSRTDETGDDGHHATAAATNTVLSSTSTSKSETSSNASSERSDGVPDATLEKEKNDKNASDISDNDPCPAAAVTTTSADNTTTRRSAAQMNRRGKHKLVRADLGSETRHKLQSTENKTGSGDPRENTLVRTTPTTAYGCNDAKVLQCLDREELRKLVTRTGTGTIEVGRQDPDAATMKRTGTHKLVRSSPEDNKNKDATKIPALAYSTNHRSYTAGSSSRHCIGRKRKQYLAHLRPSTHHHIPRAKRIKLPDIESKSSSGGEETGARDGASPPTANAVDDTDQQPQQPKGKKFTDFAYHSLAASKQVGSRGVSGGRTGGAGRNNRGLVRVQPDTSKTPICPTFLRGVACTNPTCLKRHDIPKEYTMPVCSYFQRNGMCLKQETCPFRHVKVNPLATPCPTFEVLGFCDDKTCALMHRSSRPSVPKNKFVLGKSNKASAASAAHKR